MRRRKYGVLSQKKKLQQTLYSKSKYSLLCLIVISMKRNVKAGIALGFLSFLHNDKAILIAGAIMMVVGGVVSTFLGLVLVEDYTSGNISPLDARPYPVYGIISPLYTQIVFIIIAVLGLGLVAWSISGTGFGKS